MNTEQRTLENVLVTTERKLDSNDRDQVIAHAKLIFVENAVRNNTSSSEALKLAEHFYRTARSYRNEAFKKESSER
jgi:hypothetical protein